MKFRPIENRIAVELDDELKQTAGGIIIPDNVQQRPQRGLIVAAGLGKKGEPMTLKVGEYVIFGKGTGTPTPWDLIGGVQDKEYLIMREPDVFGVV